MTSQEARAVIAAHIAEVEKAMKEATPGRLRLGMDGYSIKSNLHGTPHDGDYLERIAAIPGGVHAVPKAIHQFQNDADKLVVTWNSLPAHLIALRFLKQADCEWMDGECPTPPNVIVRLPRCPTCAALIAVAEELQKGNTPK